VTVSAPVLPLIDFPFLGAESKIVKFCVFKALLARLERFFPFFISTLSSWREELDFFLVLKSEDALRVDLEAKVVTLLEMCF
jgi:hypothetical protein